MGRHVGEVAIGVAVRAVVGVGLIAGSAPAWAEGGHDTVELRFPSEPLPISSGRTPARPPHAQVGSRPPVVTLSPSPRKEAGATMSTSAAAGAAVRATPDPALHDDGPPRALIPVARLAGRAVVTPHNTRIGTLHEIAFAPEGGALYAVVASIGSDGGHLVAIPAGNLRLRATGALEAPVAEEMVADLPPVRPPRAAPTQSALLPAATAGPYRLTP